MMSTANDEQVSSQERQRIFSELKSLRQDTQELRTAAYHLRITSDLDTATMRAQQQGLEQRATALIRQLSLGRERNVEPDSASDNAMDVSSASQPQLPAGNCLQLQG